jgi:hypothetical protein
MKRILAWRQDFSSTMGAIRCGKLQCQLLFPSFTVLTGLFRADSPPLKRKSTFSDEQEDGDVVGPTSIPAPWLLV